LRQLSAKAIWLGGKTGYNSFQRAEKMKNEFFYLNHRLRLH
jgi:hypothetical protein